MTFYFKFEEGCYRDDSIVVYCNTKQLPFFINILRDIKKEDEKIASSIHNPTILSGVVDGWIGYGSEPDILPSGKLTSFNEKRSNHLQSIIDQQVFRSILQNQNMILNFQGRKTNYRDYLIQNIVEDKIEMAAKSTEFYKNPKASLGYTKEDILNINFSKQFSKIVTENYSSIVNSIKNNTPFFLKIPINNTYIYLRKNDIENSFRKQIKLLIKNENFKKNLKQAIKDSSKKVGIDPNNYAFDLKSIEQFRKIDNELANNYTSKDKNTKRKKYNYNPMTDEEIRISQRKIGFLQVNSQYPYQQSSKIQRTKPGAFMFDYNLEKGQKKKYTK